MSISVELHSGPRDGLSKNALCPGMHRSTKFWIKMRIFQVLCFALGEYSQYLTVDSEPSVSLLSMQFCEACGQELQRKRTFPDPHQN